MEQLRMYWTKPQFQAYYEIYHSLSPEQVEEGWQRLLQGKEPFEADTNKSEAKEQLNHRIGERERW